MFVQDVMTREPATVSTDTAVKRAATVLVQRQISSLPVLDTEGRLCGVVGEADFIRDAFAPDVRTHMRPPGDGHRSPAHLVSELMTRHAVTVHESTDIAETAELMTSTGLKSLPVVDDDGRLVGMVSRSDLVRVRARADDAIASEIDSMLVSLGHANWLVEVNDGAVDIEGPETALDISIAKVAANTVAGVGTVSVR
jgi:CBS domain-containing protein